MTRKRLVVEAIYCDVCGAEVDRANTRTLGFGGERWEIDVCAADLKTLQKTFDKWTKNGRRLEGRRRTAKQAVDEWEYLEKLGFQRHRGRKSAAEIAALAKR